MTRSVQPPVRGVLLGDQTNDTIYLLQDLNLDGDAADLGERPVFFDETNLSRLLSPTGSILNITQASDGAVFAADGTTDAVYRLVDLNGDGDANDEGEATVWFSEAENASAFTLPTPNGVAEGPDGAIYIVNAGVSSRPADVIYRTVDLNNDGDANDEGEATIFLDLDAFAANSSAFDIFFIRERGYVMDTVGADDDSIFTFKDEDGSGAIETDEITIFANAITTGVPFSFGGAPDNGSVIVWESLDFDTGVLSIFRLTDLDGSGAIDQANETEEIWNTTELPAIFDSFAGFSIATDEHGQIVVTSNDSEPQGDNVYVLNDLNGDGDYFDTGETNILASRAFDPETLERPRSLAYYEGKVNEAPTLLGAGNHFSLFLDPETHTLYAAGESLLGQLGQGVKGFDVAAPLEVVLPEGFEGEIASVSAGLIHGAFLTEDGDVYTWGFGNFGRLGHGDDEERLIPEKITGELDDKTVKIIDMGNGVSFAITDDGTLYGWGQNTSGQLGLGDEVSRNTPTKIDIDGKTVVAVSSGTAFTLVLTSDGAVYGFGSNRDGQAAPTELDAPGDPTNEVLSPVRIEGLPSNIVAVTADTQTSYAVTSDGRVFGWGENQFGQLLVGTDNGDGTFIPTDDKILVPVELEFPAFIVDVKGGARWGAALTNRGDVYLWGPNDEGPTGGLDGDPAAESDVNFFPTEIAALETPNIVEIQSGPNHLLAIDDEGKIYSFGSNSDGRLGYLTEGSTYEPQLVDLTADAPPFLLAATPGDNARDIEASTSFELLFTEDVFVGTGEIRIVNRDDETDVRVVDVNDRLLVQVDGPNVLVTPISYLRLDARYAIEIDEGAFVDEIGQAFPGIAMGDTSTFNFSVSENAPDTDRILAQGTGRLILGDDNENLIVGTAGDDRLLGRAADDDMFGELGDDTLEGGAGGDLLVGGLGKDTARYTSAQEGVTVNLADTSQNAGDALGDMYLEVEAFQLSRFGDVFVGEMGTEAEVEGFGGNDTITGSELADLLDGGVGDDSVLGEAGDDTVIGRDGVDDLSGGAGNDQLSGGNDNDVLLGGLDDDKVFGGNDNDTLIGGAGRDTAFGGAGDDLFVLDASDDVDVVITGTGADIVDVVAGDGFVRVRDFEDGSDLLRLRGGLTFEALTFDGERVLAGTDVLAILQGLQTSQLTSDDFLVF